MEVDEGVDTSDSDTSAVVIDYDETTSEGEDDISFVGTHQAIPSAPVAGQVELISLDNDVESIGEGGRSPELIEVDSDTDTEDAGIAQAGTGDEGGDDLARERPRNPVPPDSPELGRSSPSQEVIHSPVQVPQASRHITITTDEAEGVIHRHLPGPLSVDAQPPRPHAGDGVMSVLNTEHAATSTERSLVGSNSGGHLDDPSSHSDRSHNQSLQDFRMPKKYKPKSPPKVSIQPSQEKEDAAEPECPICFEAWTNSGLHRLASLKCGHLFGQSCIEKWLKGRGGKCPQCNAKATKKDVRVLYAKTIKTLDTSERDRALVELEKERDARKEAELSAAQARMRCQMALEEVSRLRQDLERAQQQVDNTGQTSSQAVSSTQGSASNNVADGSRSFVFDRVIKVWDQGKCRVMAYNAQLATLVVSQPSASPLFPGFGVKKISSLDFKTAQYVSIHQNVIRDVAFNPASNDGLLLSCAMDKTVKITSLTSNTVVQSYQCLRPVWACAWNADNPSYFYAGEQNGVVTMFDTRNTRDQVQQINTPVEPSPVVSLQYIPLNLESCFKPGGLLVGQLNRSTFFEAKAGGDFRAYCLSTEAQLTCLSLEGSTRHLLSSHRPTARNPSTKHHVYQLRCVPGGGVGHTCLANKLHTFHGGGTQKLLARSRLLPHPTDPTRLIVCAADEASLSIFIWDVSVGQLRQKIPAHAPVLDICSITANNQCYLAALTEKNIRLHRWT